MREVTQEEYREFVSNHPTKLERDVCGISDPPLESYNDFSDGKVWPQSMVAKCSLGDDRGPSKYWIDDVPKAQEHWTTTAGPTCIIVGPYSDGFVVKFEGYSGTNTVNRDQLTVRVS